MRKATEFMQLAAHCRRQARSEPDFRVRLKLEEAAIQYDARACANMMAAESA